MHKYGVPGLVGDIADHIATQTYKTCESFVVGAALAIMSSISGARYRVAYPTLDPADDHAVEPQVVYQSVMLVGPSGSGKGLTMETVGELFVAIDDPAYIGGAASWQALWKAAERTPGLLWIMQHIDHHELIRRDLDWPRNNRVEPKISDVLTALQRSADLDVAELPLPTRSEKIRSYIRSSPVTILTESTLMSFKKRLPARRSVSYFFEYLLLCGVSQPPIRNKNCGGVASEALVMRIRKLASLRNRKETIFVQWEKSAFERLRFFSKSPISTQCRNSNLIQDGRMPPKPDWTIIIDKAMNIAALLAIGVDADFPTITEEMLLISWKLVENDWLQLQAGLDVQAIPDTGH